jgi:hypothetical protein
MAQQRFSHQLLQQQIENKVAQALLIEDEARKRAELESLHTSQKALARRQLEIEDEEHKARWQSLALVNAAHKREAERLQEWEDEVALERQRAMLRDSSLLTEEANQKVEEMRRTGAQAEAIAQYEKLLRTIDADAIHSRQAQQLTLEGEEARNAMKRQAQEAEWQHALRRLEHEREEKFAHMAHVADMARVEIARAETIGAMSDTAKVALASAPNAAVLADYMKTQVHAGMSPDQLSALSGVVAATNNVTAQEAARMAGDREQLERTRRDVEVDKDRRHQLDLLNLQNDVNKAALAAQSALGVGVAHGRAPILEVRHCASGHAALAGDRFCAQCGAALQP